MAFRDEEDLLVFVYFLESDHFPAFVAFYDADFVDDAACLLQVLYHLAVEVGVGCES